jgi:hypothetical protein
MPHKYKITECCGVDYFAGLQFSRAFFKEWLEKAFDSPQAANYNGWFNFDIYTEEKIEGGSYFPEAGPAMYLLFLDAKQVAAFKDELSDYDFKPLAGPIRNPRMKNLTTFYIYGRISTIDYYGKFMNEKAREIWTRNLTLD